MADTVLTWNLGDLFEAVVDAVGDRTAVVSGGVRLTFAALDERANRLADVLERAGIGEGDRVALVLRNGNEYLEAMFGAFKLRAVPVNVNTRYTTEEIAAILADADPAFVVYEPDLADTVSGAVARLDPDRVRGYLARGAVYEDAIRRAGPDRPVVSRSGDDRYLLYTGGTTGHPKGVLWRHEDLLFAALGAAHPGGDPLGQPAEIVDRAKNTRTRALLASPFTHGTAQWTALSTLLHGGTVIVDPSPNLDVGAIWDLARDERATVLTIVGDAFARPLADALATRTDRDALSELLMILSGGALLSPVVRDQLLKLLPWTVVVDGYGTSETGAQGQMPVWAGQAGDGSLRFHVDGDTTVLDDAGRPAPPGSGLVGRLARRGRLPLGYHGDPIATAAIFVVIDGQRWAIPGDLARVEADGSVTLLGRGHSSINTGGEKVFPEEVETVLKAHPGVFDAVVVPVADQRFGERVAAVISTRSGATVTFEDLERHCREHLAPFKVPRSMVHVAQVRRRPTGKVDLAWAREVVAADREAAGSS